MSVGFEELSGEQCRHSTQCHSFEVTRIKSPEGQRAMMAYDYPHPVSRTYQYKKITKPLLERKRRARINACLDELKDLMVDALETEGENINKLEKADILELTVRHLQRLQAARPSGISVTATQPTNEEASAESRWQSGFGHCAAEACRFLSALPGEAAERLARHLAAGLQMHRRPDATTKPNLLTPTLSNLEQTANAVSPCSVGSTTETHTTTSPRPSAKRATPYPERNAEKLCETSISPPLSTPPTPITADAQEANSQRRKKDERNSCLRSRTSDASRTSEDEEEIDVEGVDEGDPMWRPW